MIRYPDRCPAGPHWTKVLCAGGAVAFKMPLPVDEPSGSRLPRQEHVRVANDQIAKRAVLA